MTADRLDLTGAGLTALDVEAIGEAIAAARAPSTRKTYASAWRVFEGWCAGRGVATLPADPVHVAAHLVERHRSGGISASRLAVTLASIRAEHLDAGYDDPTAVRGVQLTIRGLRRLAAGDARKQAHPLTVSQLRRMLTTLDQHTLAGKRDAAILLVGYAAALRRSEIAALHVHDLTWKSEGLVVRIAKSKADQEGKGALIGVRRGDHAETDPVSAVHDWITAASVSGMSPLFQGVPKGGQRVTGRPLTVGAINTIVQRAAVAAGLSDLPISAHSLRAGHATTASENGVPATRLARTTRHANLTTLAIYIRPAEALADTSSGSLGL